MITRVATRIVQIVALPLVLIGLWAWASTLVTSYYFPTPQAIGTAFANVWSTERLRGDVLPSVLRLSAGLLLATLLGIGLGLAIGLSRRLRSITEPTLEFLRAIPPPVLVPILLLLAGIGDGMKVLVIISGCLWPILLNTIEGIRGLERGLIRTCEVFRIGRLERLRHLVLKGASPHIMTGIRQALPIGVILMVISEMFTSSSGLGFMIVQFQHGFDIAEMWSGTVLLGLLGLTLALLYWLVERRVLSWYHGQRKSTSGRSA